MDTGTETGSDEEEDEDEDQMNVSGMRGVGKKKFLFCVSQSLRSGWCRVLIEMDCILVEHERDQGILMVEMIYDGERTRAFKVFQLILDGKDWKLTKEDLGDIALFVGGSSTVALSASTVSGCLANQIYFLQDWNSIAREDAWLDDSGTYNRSIHLISKTHFPI